MAHILEAKISGLAGRDHSTALTFDRHLNVIFGENGGGKTSLLKILDSAMGDEAESLSMVRFKSAEVKLFMLSNDCVVTRTIKEAREEPAKVVELPDGSSIRVRSAESKRKWTTKTDKPTNEPVERLRHEYLPVSRLYVHDRRAEAYAELGREVTGRETFREHNLDAYFARKLRSLWRSYSVRILQQVQQAQQAGIASILKGVLSAKRSSSDIAVGDAAKAYQTLNSFLRRQAKLGNILGSPAEFAKLYQKYSDVRSIVNDIEKIEKQIEQALRPQEELKELINGMFSHNKKVSFSEHEIRVDGGELSESIPLPSLSSGEKHLLQLYVETLIAEESTIIIDEPEISLHIDWQRSLMKNLRRLNPNCQVVVATHSPEIMADVEDQFIQRI